MEKIHFFLRILFFQYHQLFAVTMYSKIISKSFHRMEKYSYFKNLIFFFYYIVLNTNRRMSDLPFSCSELTFSMI